MRKHTVKLETQDDIDKVQLYRDTERRLQDKAKVLTAEITEHLESVTRQNNEAVESFQKEWHDTLLPLYQAIVADHFPDTDMEKAFASGEVYLDMSYFEQFGDAFLIKYLDAEKEPTVAVDESAKRTLH